MKAILLFSHGSVLCGASENLRALAQRMQNDGFADIVEVGYLNYSAPLFDAAFKTCVEKGATEIVIAPYFLVAGKFVRVDLPPHIEAMRAQFPHVRVVVADAMRFHPALAQAIANCASRVLPPSQWRDNWKLAPQFCRDNAQCPLNGTPRCPAFFQEAAAENSRQESSVVSRESFVPFSDPVASRERFSDLVSSNESANGLISQNESFANALSTVGNSANAVAGNESSTSAIPAHGSLPNANMSSEDSSNEPLSGACLLARSALVVMVHGSPRPESNVAVYQVLDLLRAQQVFAHVEVGFMECNEPTIADSLEKCVALGARRVVAVPYFLHTGNHVSDDLPQLLEEAQAKYPDVEWLMGDYLGRDAAIAEILRDRVLEAQTTE